MAPSSSFCLGILVTLILSPLGCTDASSVMVMLINRRSAVSCYQDLVLLRRHRPQSPIQCDWQPSRGSSCVRKLVDTRYQSRTSPNRHRRNLMNTFLQHGSAVQELGRRVFRNVSVVAVMLGIGLSVLQGRNAAGCGSEIADDTNQIESLTTAQARLLVADFRGVESGFEAGGTGRVVVQNGLPLNGLIALDSEAASILAGSGYTILLLDGLVTIPLDTLRALGGFRGGLSLGGLTHLTPEAARCIAKAKCRKLSLRGVAAVGETAMSALAEWRGGQLALNGLTSLPPEVARALAAAQIGGLGLNGLTTLDADAAKALTAWTGCYLELDGLTTLSVETASGLSGFRGIGPQLSMLGLETLCSDAAEALASFNGRRLRLSGVTIRSVETASALARYKGDLSLWDVGSLSTEVARAISTHKGGLELKGLSALSDEAAHALARHEGELAIDGTITLSGKAADALAQHIGRLHLNGRAIAPIQKE